MKTLKDLCWDESGKDDILCDAKKLRQSALEDAVERSGAIQNPTTDAQVEYIKEKFNIAGREIKKALEEHDKK